MAHRMCHGSPHRQANSKQNKKKTGDSVFQCVVSPTTNIPALRKSAWKTALSVLQAPTAAGMLTCRDYDPHSPHIPKYPVSQTLQIGLKTMTIPHPAIGVASLTANECLLIASFHSSKEDVSRWLASARMD
jgi:hypothetical protein